MLVNKIGFEHLLKGLNCQDYGLETESLKCVVDGCSEGTNSEVGAKLFIHLLKRGMDITVIFEILTAIFVDYESVKNHLLFTILLLEEAGDCYIVRECGDGYIIKQRHNDSLEYQKIDYQGIPPYFAYNYVEKEHLSKYKDGVSFNIFRFSKREYKAIGIATDGLSFILDSSYKERFETMLIGRKAIAINRLININHNYQFAINSFPLSAAKQCIPLHYTAGQNNFHDDFTIAI